MKCPKCGGACLCAEYLTGKPLAAIRVHCMSCEYTGLWSEFEGPEREEQLKELEENK